MSPPESEALGSAGKGGTSAISVSAVMGCTGVNIVGGPTVGGKVVPTIGIGGMTCPPLGAPVSVPSSVRGIGPSYGPVPEAARALES